MDLITVAHDLLFQLPVTVTITHQWVKGHYTGEKELQHKLNYQADELASRSFLCQELPSASPHL